MNNMKSGQTNKIKSFTQLNAWKEGHKLVLTLYKATKEFPKEEKYGLVDQIRRAAVSVVSNIAEGFSRESYKEKVQYYAMSKGSVTEIQSQLLIARDLQYMGKKEFDEVAEQTVVVHKILSGLIKKSKTQIMT